MQRVLLGVDWSIFRINVDQWIELILDTCYVDMFNCKSAKNMT